MLSDPAVASLALVVAAAIGAALRPYLPFLKGKNLDPIDAAVDAGLLEDLGNDTYKLTEKGKAARAVIDAVEEALEEVPPAPPVPAEPAPPVTPEE